VDATICPRPVTLTFDLLTLKSMWESHVTLGTPVQSFVFLGLLVFELEPMYATSDRRTDGRTTDADHRLMPRPHPTGRGIIITGRPARSACHAGIAFTQWSKNGFFAPSGETSDRIKNVRVQKWHGPLLSPCQVWWGSWVGRWL